ncbi:MAG: restriction endonuclease subunit S [Candidatus Cryosericum sp.]
MDGWAKRRIGTLGRVVTGKTPPTADRENFDGAYPFITIPDLDGRVWIDRTARSLSEKGAHTMKSCLLPRGTVMMSCIATIGRCGITAKPSFTNQQINGVVPEATVDPEFLYYVFTQLSHELDAAGGGGSVYTNVSKSRFSDIEINIPVEVEEQRAIARTLGALDDKIELNRQMSETLEAMARALFKSWFIDFDPVRARTEGRDPGLPADIAALFPDSFEDSDLGEIPKGWSVGSVDDDFELTMGQSPPGETYNEAGDGLPFYQGRLDFGARSPTRRVYCTAPTRFASAGDTLVSVRAPVGDVNMATERCAIGRGVAAVRHKTGSRSFSYQFMRSISEVFARFDAEGTVFGSIGKKDFHAITCVRFPHNVVLEFERQLSGADSRIEINERESRTLAALRETLLPKLLSGELRVRDVEEIMEADV